MYKCRLEQSNSSIKQSTEKLISEAINFLIAELDSFTDIILTKICDHILEAIKKKKIYAPKYLILYHLHYKF